MSVLRHMYRDMANVRQYVDGWREIRRLPDDLVVHNWHGDPWWPVTIAYMKRKMRRDLHRRINERARLRAETALP